jgi:hypothetical protein
MAGVSECAFIYGGAWVPDDENKYSSLRLEGYLFLQPCNQMFQCSKIPCCGLQSRTARQGVPAASITLCQGRVDTNLNFKNHTPVTNLQERPCTISSITSIVVTTSNLEAKAFENRV